jgi:hypothetical protein
MCPLERMANVIDGPRADANTQMGELREDVGEPRYGGR